jgi:phage tail-like protein
MIRNVGRRTVMQTLGAAGAVGLVSGSGRANQTDVDGANTSPAQRGAQRTGKFVVEFDGTAVSGWKTVTLPAISIEQGTYREGNDASQTKAVAGQPTYEDLEMERGFKPDDTVLWDWVDAIRQGKVDGSRREIAVIVQDTAGRTRTRWEFTKCRPTTYEPPELDAGADGDAATESLTVAFDRMIRAE